MSFHLEFTWMDIFSFFPLQVYKPHGALQAKPAAAVLSGLLAIRSE